MKYYALQNTTTGGYFTGGMKLCHPPIYITDGDVKGARVSRSKEEMVRVKHKVQNFTEFKVVELDSREHKHLAD